MAALPESFQDLAAGLEWALPSERERFNKRIKNNQAALVSFHALLTPRMPAILDYLKAYDITGALGPDTLNLYYMALAYMEVANSVERFHEPDESGVFEADRYHVKGPEDLIVGYTAR